MTLSIDGAIVLTEPNKPHTQTQRTHDSATGAEGDQDGKNNRYMHKVRSTGTQRYDESLQQEQSRTARCVHLPEMRTGNAQLL